MFILFGTHTITFLCHKGNCDLQPHMLIISQAMKHTISMFSDNILRKSVLIFVIGIGK